MVKTCCRCPYAQIVRSDEKDNENLPQLPDEIIELIMGNVPATELIAYGWDGVSRSFSPIFHRALCSQRSYCATNDSLFKIFLTAAKSPNDLDKKFEKLLVLLMKKYFCEVYDIVLPVFLFSYIQHILIKHPFLAITNGVFCSHRLPQAGVAFSNLRKLTIQIGENYGPLTLSHEFAHLKTSEVLCRTLSEINLEITLCDNEHVTCAGFRELIIFLKEVSYDKTYWNVHLFDNTTCGQGWTGPANLSRYRNKMFICYIRAMLELSININDLYLIDKRKSSPYMLVMNKRRTIYMFPEFKVCRQLIVCYDIGLIAPIFSHENDNFDHLMLFEIDESHVLYKADLLDYLQNARKLQEVRIVTPSSWTKRFSQCTKGCFLNDDFSCFRPDGWNGVPLKLPGTHFELTHDRAANNNNHLFTN